MSDVAHELYTVDSLYDLESNVIGYLSDVIDVIDMGLVNLQRFYD